MNTPTINQLKAAVAQFDEAFKLMESTLDQALEEARDRHLNIGCAVKFVGDQATRDRLDFEEGVALEDMMSFESASRDWQRIAGEVHHWLPSISEDIDDAAGEALSFDDYKSNEAMHRDLQAKHLREANSELVKQRFEEEAVWERRIAEAREAGDRMHFIGNPEDFLPVDTAGFRFTDLGRISAVNFNKHVV